MRTVLSLAIVAMLAACSSERAPSADAAEASPSQSEPSTASPVAEPPSTSLPEPGEGGDTPVANTPDGADAQARFDGYGDLKLGFADADMAKAWGGELKTLGKDDNPTCYFMTPKSTQTPSEFNFMIGDGKFARFGTDSAKFVAPGGGKVGMTKADIGKLHATIEEQQHHYTDGLYLRIKDPAGGPGVLIFETDGKGDAAKVTEWRVGLEPYVDYVEGCS